ncbi:MAG: alpha/beta hydrolase [Frankiales bacterium]|nr:alpha/beta hydrolase [Frankiales bacterium]
MLRARLDSVVQVICPDRPGYGANPSPAGDFDANVQWLTSVLARGSGGPVVLVGHSWAGGIAILASHLPNVVGITLISSVGPDCLLPIESLLAWPGFGEVAALASLRAGQPLVHRRAANIIRGRLADEDLPYAWTSGSAMLHRPVWRSFLTEQRALVHDLPAISAALPGVPVPTLIISGRQDSLIPRHTYEQLASGLGTGGADRDVRWVEIDGGHDLPLRQPVSVAELTTSLAARVLSSAASPAQASAPGTTV